MFTFFIISLYIVYPFDAFPRAFQACEFMTGTLHYSKYQEAIDYYAPCLQGNGSEEAVQEFGELLYDAFRTCYGQ